MADEMVSEPDHAGEPDNTAVRVALWRAMHVLVDAPPHVLEDEIGLRLVNPADGWRDRPDMDPVFTSGFRASIVARARFIEDLVAERAAHGTEQYVLLGAGLDTFAQRRRDLASRLRVFEVDQPGTQAWKRRRLADLGYGVPDWPRFAGVNFEEGASWQDEVVKAGFDAAQPAVVASTGVSMYLTREANEATLRDLAALAPGSTVAMTFLLPLDLVDERDKQGWIISSNGARSSGTPFISFFAPEDFLGLARAAGFADVRHVSGRDLNDRYFAGRADGLRPSTGEDFLVATVLPALATLLTGAARALRRDAASLARMTVPFPEPASPAGSRAEVFNRYLDYFRDRLATRLRGLPAGALRSTSLPSGWTPLELLKHLTYMERRWLEWGFEGRPVTDPWGDQRGGRWYVGPDETLDDLLAALAARAEHSRRVIAAHDLGEVGKPGERWGGNPPATLERVLFHVLQEYARHLGHLDIVSEMAGGPTGELPPAVPFSPRPRPGTGGPRRAAAARPRPACPPSRARRPGRAP